MGFAECAVTSGQESIDGYSFARACLAHEKSGLGKRAPTQERWRLGEAPRI